jgi:hypothetical protein
VLLINITLNKMNIVRSCTVKIAFNSFGIFSNSSLDMSTIIDILHNVQNQLNHEDHIMRYPLA